MLEIIGFLALLSAETASEYDTNLQLIYSGNIKYMLDLGKVSTAVKLTEELVEQFPTTDNINFYVKLASKYGFGTKFINSLKQDKPVQIERLITVEKTGKFKVIVYEGGRIVTKDVDHKSYVIYRLKNGQRILLSSRTLIPLEGKVTIFFFNGMTVTALKYIMFTPTKVFRDYLEIWLSPFREEAAKEFKFTIGGKQIVKKLVVGQVVVLKLTRDVITQRITMNFEQQNFRMPRPDVDLDEILGGKEIFMLIDQRKDFFLQSVDLTDIP
ncbi:MAG: hypothetical protein HY606_01730, partial [Planctomycetes bacterium]|nr:hypothetical protein [Planctomycetota bacterium]